MLHPSLSFMPPAAGGDLACQGGDSTHFDDDPDKFEFDDERDEEVEYAWPEGQWGYVSENVRDRWRRGRSRTQRAGCHKGVQCGCYVGIPRFMIFRSNL